MRRLVAIMVAVLATATASATPAQATDYRYWSYWHGAGNGWTYATTGPAGHVPGDGTVEGWRFGVSGEQDPLRPRTDASFDAVCAGTPAQDGRKRVALVLDFGTAQDAPAGEQPGRTQTRCVVVDEGARGSVVLTAAARVRADSGGLVCGIGGYPARGCGDAVDDAQPAAPTRAADPRPPVPPTPAASRSASPRPTAARPTTARPAPTASPTSAQEDPTAKTDPTADADPTAIPAPGTVGSPTTAAPPAASAAPAASSPPAPVGSPQPESSASADEGSTSPSDGTGVIGAEDDPDGGSPAGLLVGAVLVGGVGVAAAARARHRRNP